MMSNSDQQPLSEFDLIDQYFHKTTQNPFLSLGIGDDCAVVSVPSDMELVFSMDTLVMDRHFPHSATPHQIAERTFCTCLSDLAAMGAEPQWFTLALTLPEANRQWLQTFSKALLNIAQEYNCNLIGGDTTQGPLVITLQVHGFVKKTQALVRHGAQLEDRVFVTGSLGDGRAALDIVNNKVEADARTKDYLIQRFYRPAPQIQAGLLLIGKANAAIDVSDGLLADLEHVATASELSIEIDIDALPISKYCRAIAATRAIDYALTGGDDYQLVFTAPEDNCQTIVNLLNRAHVPITEIGRVIPASSRPVVTCKKQGQLFPVTINKGYRHFAS